MTSDGFARPLTLGTLALMMTFSSIATDLYLPAIPEIARSLDADPRLVEASMATFLAGFVLGQLFWGPASDVNGRKRPAIIGIALFLASSIGCALAQTGEGLLAMRGLQGFGGSAAVVIARAIVTDLYTKDKAAKVMSSLIAIMALAPLLGPLLGAQILAVAGWRAIFWVLCGFAALALVLAGALRETNREARGGRSLADGFASYRVMIRTGAVMRYTVVGSCFYGGLFAFITAAPVVFIEGYGFPPSLFAALLGVGTALVVAANILNVKLIGKLGVAGALKLGAVVAGIGALAVLVAALVVPNSAESLVVAIMVYMSMAGLIVGNALTGAMASVVSERGAASAFAGAMNFAGGALGAILVAAFGAGSAAGLAIVVAIFGVLTCAASLSIEPPSQQTGQT